MARIDSFIWRYLDVIILLLCVNIFKVSGLSVKRRINTPRFLPTTTNVTVHRGGTAILECHIENLGPKKVAWRKVSKDYVLTVGLTTFDPKEDMSVSFKQINEYQSHWDLVIKRVEMKHKGMYECQISATVVHTHHVYLNVLPTPITPEPAIPSIKVTGTEFVNIFSKINLTCNATDVVEAPHDIDWFFEGQLISTESNKWRNRIQILKYTPEVPGKSLISNLIIDISSSEDSGRYVCRSSGVHAVAFNVIVLNTENPRGERDTETDSALPSKSVGKGSGDLSAKISKLILIIVLLLVMAFVT